MLIWRYTGKWEFGFGEKAAINMRLGDRAYDEVQREKFINEFEGGRFKNLQVAPENPLSFLWNNRSKLARRIGANITSVSRSYYNVLPSGKGHLALTILSIIFAGIGTAKGLSQKRSRWLSVLLLALIFVYSAPWLVIFVLDRFVIPLTVIAILFYGFRSGHS